MLLKKDPSFLLRAGMAFLLLFFILRFAARNLSGDAWDFIDGAAFGIGAGLLVLSMYLNRKRGRARM